MDTTVNVPRWTPSPSPTRTLLTDPRRKNSTAHDSETESYASEEDDLPFNNKEMDFPFSTASTTPTTAAPHHPPPNFGTFEAPSLRVDSEIRRSMEMDIFHLEPIRPVGMERVHSEQPRVERVHAEPKPLDMERVHFEPRVERAHAEPRPLDMERVHFEPRVERARGEPRPVDMERVRFEPRVERVHGEPPRSMGVERVHYEPRVERVHGEPPRSMDVERVHREPPLPQPKREDYVVRIDKNNPVHEAGPKGTGNGISLTWNDLWVTVPDKKGGRRAILQGVTGYVEPGEVLAIMGPSGCGKSTLLDTLAGRLGSNTRQTGEILINGRKQTLSFGTSAYVTQDDILMTTLTVKEAVYYSAQLQLPDSMTRFEKKERAEATIREMGLQDSMNTRIGGWSSKGLSGGQKRRVSICIEILTRPKLLFLDEPTSGLDSAASFHVMSRIIKLAQQDRRTMIASIHQPSSEVFELFSNLCLLSSGRTVYFGSTSAANEFFALNGFPCPPMRNPSDHYLRTVNKDFDADIEQGFGRRITTVEAIDTLVNAYKSSEAHQQVQKRVHEICQKNGGTLEKKGSQAGFINQCLVLTRRSFVNMYRDLGYYWLRLAIYIALCICVGTIYYDIGSTYGSIQARGSMLMFVAAFLTFMAIGGFPSFVEDMKIFTRERLNGHYGVGAYVLGNTFSSMPYLLLISVIPGAIAYYLVGLQRGIDHFVYFALMLFSCMLLVESLMMIVASVVPDFLMGIITGAGIQGVMMLNGGFFRLPNDLPNPFWKYPMYYIAFHKYANQGFYKNEFEGLTFPNIVAGGSATITGDEILRNTWQVEMGYSKWIDIAIVLGMVVLYRFMFLGIIKTVEKVKPILRSLMAGSSKHSTHVEDPYSTLH